MAIDPEERPDPSIAKFESMLKTDDVYFFDAEDFEEIIHYYLNNGKVALAKKAIKIGMQQHPDCIPLQLLHVEVLVFENHFEVAENLLDKLQLLDSTNEEIYIQRANIQSKQDNHHQAVQILETALSASPDNIDLYSLLGMEYLFMEDYQKACDNFKQCVTFDPQDYSSLYNTVYCYEFMDDFDGAIHYLNDYLEGNPYCEVAWHQLGKQYVNKDMHKEALTSFDFAIIADETFIGAYFEKANVLERLGKYNEAIVNYEMTLTLDDPTSHAYLRMGKCHEKLQNYDLAKYYFYHTVSEDPLLDKGWLAITDHYYKKAEYKKALHYINKALNIDQENPKYWKKSAKINTALKLYDDADFSFKQSVDLGNYEMDTWLDWADVTIKNGDYQAAAQILAQGLEFYPEEPRLHYKVCGVYLMLQESEKAKEHMTHGLYADSGHSKLEHFAQDFPKLHKSEWVRNLIEAHKRASR